MNMKKFKLVVRVMAYHALVLLRGFMKVLYGAGASALVAAAVIGFTAVNGEGGYMAVLDFLAAVAALCAALGSMYIIGGSRKRRKNPEE